MWYYTIGAHENDQSSSHNTSLVVLPSINDKQNDSKLHSKSIVCYIVLYLFDDDMVGVNFKNYLIS